MSDILLCTGRYEPVWFQMYFMLGYEVRTEQLSIIMTSWSRIEDISQTDSSSLLSTEGAIALFCSARNRCHG